MVAGCLALVGSPTEEGDVNGDLTSSPSPESAENHLSMARSARIMCELRHTSAEFLPDGYDVFAQLRNFGLIARRPTGQSPAKGVLN
jgi:hypothetical protein